MSASFGELDSFSAAVVASFYSANVIIIEDTEQTTSAIALLGSLVSERDTHKSSTLNSTPSVLKIGPHGDFAKAIQVALEPTKSPRAVSIITTSHVLISLLPAISRYSKIVSEPGQFIPSLAITVGVSGPNSNQADTSDVLAYFDLYCSILASSTVQSVFDFSLVSAIIAKEANVPAINYFDLTVLDTSKKSTIAFRDFAAVSELYSSQIAELVAKNTASAEQVEEAVAEQGQEVPVEGTTDIAMEESEGSLQTVDLATAVSTALGVLENSLYSPVKFYGATNASVVFVSAPDFWFGDFISSYSPSFGYLTLNQVRPFPAESILENLPSTVQKLVFLEQIEKSAKVWAPLVFDFVELTQQETFKTNRFAKPLIIDVQSSYSFYRQLAIPQNLKNLFDTIVSTNASKLLRLSSIVSPAPTTQKPSWASSSDSAREVAGSGFEQYSEVELANQLPYQKLLDTAFQQRLRIINSTNPSSIWSNTNSLETNPEYGFGIVASQEQKRKQLHKLVLQILQDPNNGLGDGIAGLLSSWLDKLAGSNASLTSLTGDLLSAINNHADPENNSVKQLKEYSEYFSNNSNWLIGSDEWAIDFSNSGVHQVLSSGFDINMLILDTNNYSDTAVDKENVSIKAINNKKDIGLYALNYGNAYVASISAYASYTQALTSLIEADSFPGPSVILAHLPASNQKLISPSYAPIESMKLSKVAVDSGKWPLYRWTPKPEADGDGAFVLDSQKLRKEIQTFLDRNNALSLVSNAVPKYYSKADSSLERDNAAAIAEAAKSDLEKLMAGLQGPSITILYASDGSNAQDAAAKINRGAKARKMNSEVLVMNDFDFGELEFKSLVVFVVSTAGQGEFPTNGKHFWKNLKDASVNLSNLKYSVFGLGDSHYWPSEEDTIFYNKPGKDLDKRLFELSATRTCDIGLGDDSDDNGWETGFSAWEEGFWSSLGYDSSVDLSGAFDDEPPKISDEDNKALSNYLRGRIVEELNDSSKGDVDEFTGKLLKFHGTYGQDDRDIRDQRLEAGLPPAYSFMIRVRLPGGKATCKQWLAIDELSSKYGNETIKITTRQTFQLHGVLKSTLRATINGMNKALMDTIAACGDVNRNVVSSANPLQPQLRDEVATLAKDLSEHLLPKTTAYHEIWVADNLVAGQAVQDFEPMYGKAYLPRKFKIAIAIPPENDVDVFAYDLGLIAILNDSEEITGYNMAVGGGMGMTHNNKKTYPRLASVIGYIDKSDVIKACEAVVTTQRDFGDRKNRKHARMKYTVDDHGIDWFRSQVEERSGVVFEPERSYHFARNGDRYGWVDSVPGYKNYTMFIQNGRVADLPGYQLRSALRTIARAHKGFIQLTCNSHVIIADVADEDVAEMDILLKKLGVHNKNHSQIRLHSMACTAFPTCGLAMAESERYLPSLVTLLDETINEAGLRNDAIVIRMTGCPNGCARPYVAEIGLVGKAPGTYNLYLGGAHNGSRLNKIYKESVQEDEILEILKPIIKNYALERLNGETFGDYVIRSGTVRETFQGLDFHN